MMSLLSQIGAFAGGIGLFLLGMWLMTDGLKIAAGNSLKHILANSTKTPVRGLLAGTGLTAVVQSSSAVTVASVGFVNAGLLTLSQAVWVIFGSNIGTTLTGWIVAFTGIQVRLDIYALPLIGLGMLIRLTGVNSKRAALGQALAGFAIFLLAIQSLKNNFSDLATQVDFSTLPSTGLSAWLLFFAIGVILTFLVQSSSATTAITISAASAGIIPVPMAALVIIGADLGTSSTAALASLGATANARRTATSHVILNLVTTGFAVVTLPLLLAGAIALGALLHLPDDPGITLALFSTTFNILGVILMLPFTAKMVSWLEKCFVSQYEEVARPRHLDATLLEVPSLALRGLLLELQRMGKLCTNIIAESITCNNKEMLALKERAASVDMLGEHIRNYVGRMNRQRLPIDIADSLAPLLRVLQNYEESIDLTLKFVTPGDSKLKDYNASRIHFSHLLRTSLYAADTTNIDFNLEYLQQTEIEAEQSYQTLKSQLLSAAADGRIEVSTMDIHMQDIVRLNRALERVHKAAQRLAPMRTLVSDAHR